MEFLETGQYNEKWKEVHMLPEDSIKAFYDLGAKAYFPVHWGMFELSFHAWNEPPRKIYSASKEKRFDVLIPKLGEILDLSLDYSTNPWWD